MPPDGRTRTEQTCPPRAIDHPGALLKPREIQHHVFSPHGEYPRVGAPPLMLNGPRSEQLYPKRDLAVQKDRSF